MEKICFVRRAVFDKINSSSLSAATNLMIRAIHISRMQLMRTLRIIFLSFLLSFRACQKKREKEKASKNVRSVDWTLIPHSACREVEGDPYFEDILDHAGLRKRLVRDLGKCYHPPFQLSL